MYLFYTEQLWLTRCDVSSTEAICWEWDWLRVWPIHRHGTLVCFWSDLLVPLSARLSSATQVTTCRPTEASCFNSPCGWESESSTTHVTCNFRRGNNFPVTPALRAANAHNACDILAHFQTWEKRWYKWVRLINGIVSGVVTTILANQL